MRDARRRRARRCCCSSLFVVVPLVEIYVLIQVGQAIGPWWTILLLVLDSILGTWLIRHEGGAGLAGAARGARQRPDAGHASSPTAR